MCSRISCCVVCVICVLRFEWWWLALCIVVLFSIYDFRFCFVIFFFFNDTATTEIYTLSLHDALPISVPALRSRVGYRPVKPVAAHTMRRTFFSSWSPLAVLTPKVMKSMWTESPKLVTGNLARSAPEIGRAHV